ncbi:TPA: hypothetical protein PPJ21_004820 [Escherichia coli]|nr:hypothetical protein [Escherichia coli]EJZ9618796.1 hypothetical protein [Escherichia coli]MBS9063325.1 hypothetical protein [Escherichia coli]HBA8953086.1 hypothetical protein [Escherichia coli]HBA9743238.1 hypothetical protein [Escherichia coli]
MAPSALDQQRCSVVESHSARAQLLRTCRVPPNPFGFGPYGQGLMAEVNGALAVVVPATPLSP